MRGGSCGGQVADSFQGQVGVPLRGPDGPQASSCKWGAAAGSRSFVHLQGLEPTGVLGSALKALSVMYVLSSVDGRD